MIDQSQLLHDENSKTQYAPWIIAIAYLFVLGFAEALTIFIAPLAGMILHGLILIALLNQAAFVVNRQGYRFLVALALAPLIRLVSLMIPVNNFPLFYWYLVVGIPLCLAVILTVRLLDLNGSSIGLCLPWRTIPTQLLIGASGLLLGYIEYLILRPESLIVGLDWEQLWLPALILLIFTGLLEEVIFRGIMQTATVEYLGKWGLLYIAVLFTTLHLGFHSLLNTMFVFAVGFLFGFIAWKTRSIIGISLSHGLMNVSLFLVFPIILAGTASGISDPIMETLLAEFSPTETVMVTDAPSHLPTGNPPPTKMQPVISINSSIVEGGDNTISSDSDVIQPDMTMQSCSPPPSWVVYSIKPGDTLDSLSDQFGIDINVLLYISCLEAADQITVDQQVFVPLENTSIPKRVSTVGSVSTTENPSSKPPLERPDQYPTATPLPTKHPAFTPRPSATGTRMITPTLAPTLAVVTSAPTSEPLPPVTPGG